MVVVSLGESDTIVDEGDTTASAASAEQFSPLHDKKKHESRCSNKDKGTTQEMTHF